MNSKVDWFFNKETKWKLEYSELRKIILECELTEGIKWGCPCYINEKNNILLIHGFKHYCAILLMQGALLKDEKKILIQQTENVQSARQLRFVNVQEILNSKSIIKKYINEAIEIDKAGLKTIIKKPSEYKIPEEFIYVLEKMQGLKLAFESLSSGRQKAYIFYFSSAKQSKTREARVEKYIPKILFGKGLDD
jgi:uncharacterized protein YdeI (YjbR/CyaY-like superfamily)